MVLHELQRPIHPSVDRMVGGFEGQHDECFAAVARTIGRGLLGIEEAEIGWIEAGLGDGAYRGRTGMDVAKAERGTGAKARPVLEAHPGFGDHAERALGADHEPVGTWPGAGAGQPAAL